MMRRKAFSLTELLVITAIVAILSAILFPVFFQARQAAKINLYNLRKIVTAAIRYGNDADDRIPVMINGPYRNMRNIRDGAVTAYGEQRTDGWPLILLPYLKDRTVYIDPRRGDEWGIWRGPALATSDAGYVAFANTYRNQSRFPMFAVNYIFLSPLKIPDDKLSDATPTDHMVGEAKRFSSAQNPARTVFYTPSYRGWVPE
ncbi:MAG: hypothetical protein QOJ65_2173, partial [Fimbriimonadaceae bacterium]|nr:hypothetical protein [Fimbriimonadaceae bacterium]